MKYLAILIICCSCATSRTWVEQDVRKMDRKGEWVEAVKPIPLYVFATWAATTFFKIAFIR